jgi:PTH1 family peptidyl-tRNA hydrolase
MKVVVGLGNPGEEYAHTRHNAGFIVLDEIFGQSDWNKSPSGSLLWKRATIAGENAEVFKPQTYMNDSGQALKPVILKNELIAEDVIVVHDEIDLPFGTLRISYDRGDGGHNGIKSMVSVLNSKAFVRIRVGISIIDDTGVLRKPDVLGPFAKSDMAKFPEISDRIKKAIETLVTDGREKAMTLYNN